MREVLDIVDLVLIFVDIVLDIEVFDQVALLLLEVRVLEFLSFPTTSSSKSSFLTSGTSSTGSWISTISWT